MEFGGTSVGNADRIDAVASLVAPRPDEGPFVVEAKDDPEALRWLHRELFEMEAA